MFVTAENVERLTGYEVDSDLIFRAQAIIESYVGRLEIEVEDAYDTMLLGRATAYQAAYMKEDPSRIFEQMSVSQLSQFGASISFKQGDLVSPFVAPLAVISCQRLSWKRMRSVKTGSIFAPLVGESGWRYE
jgi:hypothetical protein